MSDANFRESTSHIRKEAANRILELRNARAERRRATGRRWAPSKKPSPDSVSDDELSIPVVDLSVDPAPEEDIAEESDIAIESDVSIDDAEQLSALDDAPVYNDIEASAPVTEEIHEEPARVDLVEAEPQDTLETAADAPEIAVDAVPEPEPAPAPLEEAAAVEVTGAEVDPEPPASSEPVVEAKPSKAPRKRKATRSRSSKKQAKADTPANVTSAESAEADEPAAAAKKAARKPRASSARAKRPKTITSTRPAASSIDLDILPGIGAGLRWRLGQLGIDSVNDLAQTDVEHLRTQLGEIGQLLNMDYWVDMAKDKVAESDDR